MLKHVALPEAFHVSWRTQAINQVFQEPLDFLVVRAIIVWLTADNATIQFPQQKVNVPSRRCGKKLVDLAKHDMGRVGENADAACGEDAANIWESCGAGLVKRLERFAEEDVNCAEVLVKRFRL